MKKILPLFILLCLVCVFAAVRSGTTAPRNGGGSSAASKRVDVDVTALSSTMVYAQIFDMFENPKNYFGKTIRVRGIYKNSYYDVTDKYYHYMLIADAAACCQQGFEFIWNGTHAFPADYPKADAPIEVVGVFSSYEEQEYTYYYLATDGITRL
jgi:hypothetical protein